MCLYEIFLNKIGFKDVNYRPTNFVPKLAILQSFVTPPQTDTQ